MVEPSSWKLETSQTKIVSFPFSKHTEVSGTPMFPQSTTSKPFSFKIFATSMAVVVLPFVPVMAMIFPLQNRYPKSSSDKIFVFFSFKMERYGLFLIFTPGLKMQ